MTITSSPAAVLPFSIDATSPTRPVIAVDGHDVTDGTLGLTLTIAKGQLPELVIYRDAASGLVQGIASISQTDVDASALAAADALLAQLDAETVHHEALDSLDFGCGEYDTTQAIIDRCRRTIQEAMPS